MVTVNVLTDWGRAFVDPDGSFYCGTTEAQKDNAVRIARSADLIVFFSDVHSIVSTEFVVHGGLYPPHCLVRKDWGRVAPLGVPEGKTVSPELTAKLQAVVSDRPSALFVPRHVFHQDFDGPGSTARSFELPDVVETFGIEPGRPEAVLDGETTYVVCAKHMFSGAGLQEGAWMSQEPLADSEHHVFSVLKRKFGLGRDLQLNITGVVMGICVYQTASSAVQWFPKAQVNVVADSCTHLVYAPLGIEDAKTGDLVVRKMCQQVGVNYVTTAEYLARQER